MRGSKESAGFVGTVLIENKKVKATFPRKIRRFTKQILKNSFLSRFVELNSTNHRG